VMVLLRRWFVALLCRWFVDGSLHLMVTLYVKVVAKICCDGFVALMVCCGDSSLMVRCINGYV